jgi:hypothetical protein
LHCILCFVTFEKEKIVSRLESDGETFDQRFNLRRKFFHGLQSNHETFQLAV